MNSIEKPENLIPTEYLHLLDWLATEMEATDLRNCLPQNIKDLIHKQFDSIFQLEKACKENGELSEEEFKKKYRFFESVESCGDCRWGCIHDDGYGSCIHPRVIKPDGTGMCVACNDCCGAFESTTKAGYLSNLKEIIKEDIQIDGPTENADWRYGIVWDTDGNPYGTVYIVGVRYIDSQKELQVLVNCSDVVESMPSAVEVIKQHCQPDYPVVINPAEKYYGNMIRDSGCPNIKFGRKGNSEIQKEDIVAWLKHLVKIKILRSECPEIWNALRHGFRYDQMTPEMNAFMLACQDFALQNT